MKKIIIIFTVIILLSGCATMSAPVDLVDNVPIMLSPYIKEAQFLSVDIDCESDICRYSYDPPEGDQVVAIVECTCENGNITKIGKLKELTIK